MEVVGDETVTTVCCTASYNGELGITVHHAHTLGLALPVSQVALDYAKRIYPDVANSKGAGKLDCLAVGFGEVGLRKSGEKVGDVFVVEFDGVADSLAPAVGECDVWLWAW